MPCREFAPADSHSVFSVEADGLVASRFRDARRTITIERLSTTSLEPDISKRWECRSFWGGDWCLRILRPRTRLRSSTRPWLVLISVVNRRWAARSQWAPKKDGLILRSSV